MPAATPWPTAQAVQTALAAQLPGYMVPAAVCLLDAFPLTPNGKIDRNALPSPTGTMDVDRRVVSPRNGIEHRLSQIWEGLLDVRPVGVTDDFFDLGGHSLRVLGLAAEIERAFGRRIPIASIYRARTVAGLAALLQEENAAPDTPAVVLRAAFFPTSK